MLRLLADENFNGDIVRGLLRQRPDMALVRVHDVGLEEADDPVILEWAAGHNRILLTHGRATMPDFAYERVVAGQPMPGIFVLNDRLPLRRTIDELLLISESGYPRADERGPPLSAFFCSLSVDCVHSNLTNCPGCLLYTSWNLIYKDTHRREQNFVFPSRIAAVRNSL